MNKPKKAKTKSTKKGRSKTAKVSKVNLLRVTSKVWCPECKSYVSGSLPPELCDPEAEAHNLSHRGHHAYCVCKQRG